MLKNVKYVKYSCEDLKEYVITNELSLDSGNNFYCGYFNKKTKEPHFQDKCDFVRHI